MLGTRIIEVCQQTVSPGISGIDNGTVSFDKLQRIMRLSTIAAKEDRKSEEDEKKNVPSPSSKGRGRCPLYLSLAIPIIAYSKMALQKYR
jgi:hypothetical protein